MRLLPTKIAEAVLDLDRDGLKGSDLAKSLTDFLRRKRSLKLLSPTIRALERALGEREGRVTVQVTSAQALDRELQVLVRNKAQTLFGQDGKQVEAFFHEDRSLLGGVRLATEDTQYDFSLNRTLKELKRQL